MFYKKALAQIVFTIIAAVMPLLTNSEAAASDWVNVAIIGVGAFTVFVAPNVPGAAYTKGIIAAFTASLTLLASVLTDGIAQTEWTQIALAFLSAIAVAVLKNGEEPPLRAVDNVRSS